MTRYELFALATKLLVESRIADLSVEESYYPEKNLSAVEHAKLNAGNALYRLCELMQRDETLQQESYDADVRGEEAYRRAHTPPIKRGNHDFDEESVCTRCGFDGAEHHHWRTQTHEGRAAALKGKANEPPCH